MICEESKLDTRPRMQKVNSRVQDEPFTVVGNVEARDKHEGPSNSGMQTNGRSPVREQLHPRNTVHDERLKGEENMKKKIFENVLDRSKTRRIGFVCQTTSKKQGQRRIMVKFYIPLIPLLRFHHFCLSIVFVYCTWIAIKSNRLSLMFYHLLF